MQCPECQFDNPAGSKFCNECGSKLDISCPNSSNQNPEGSKFCNECGHNLSKGDVHREATESLPSTPAEPTADELFQKSIHADETSGAVVLAARTQYYRADMLARKGEIEPARSLWAEVQKQFQSWGISVWQLKCEQALQTIKGG